MWPTEAGLKWLREAKAKFMQPCGDAPHNSKDGTHLWYQHKVARWLVKKGWKAEIEQCLNQKCVDVGAILDGSKVMHAYEIVYSPPLDKEIENLKKDLDDGWHKVVFCAATKDIQQQMDDLIEAQLGVLHMEIVEYRLLRFQSGQQRELSGSTINQRVAIVDRALRTAFPDAPGQIAPGFQQTYWQRAPMGIGRPRLALSRLRVKPPKRTIVPLSVDEVSRFWSSFRTSRDLAIVGLMLLQGLRSQEVLDLNRDDLLLPEAQIRVRGKGNKTRFLPLAPEATQLLDHYLRLERPDTPTNALFVSLKGPARGARMTPAGLRSLFRHHRRTTGVKIANPHRFRHTFASDMVRAGVSLPALMQLMGHAQIQTTLVYMQVTPLEVYQQYARAVAQHIRPAPVTSP